MTHLGKSSLAAILSSLLLYYSVAWAVLKCFHHENESGAVAAVLVKLVGERQFVPLLVPQSGTDLDCVGSNYHTETLAGSSVPSRLATVAAGSSNVNRVWLEHRIGCGHGSHVAHSLVRSRLQGFFSGGIFAIPVAFHSAHLGRQPIGFLR